MLDLHSLSTIIERQFEKEFQASFDHIEAILGQNKDKGIRFQKDFSYDDSVSFHLEMIFFETGYVEMDVYFPFLVDRIEKGSLINAFNKKDRVFSLSVMKDSSLLLRRAFYTEDVFEFTMELKGTFEAFKAEFDDVMDFLHSIHHHG